MKRLRNGKGLTLVEVLATLVVASLVMILIVNIHLLIQNQYTIQSKKSQELVNVAIAMKDITREIRSAARVDVVDNTVVLNDGAIIYELNENNVLMKNDIHLIYHVKRFDTSMDENKITIEIESESGRTLDTEIVIR